MDDFIKMYNNKPKLLDQLRKTLRLKHYSLKTEIRMLPEFIG